MEDICKHSVQESKKQIVYMKFFKHYILIIILVCATPMVAQDIPQHLGYTQIYDFIEELAQDQVISINSVVKPYSRKFIAEKLKEASAVDSLLNKRQKNDLAFFMNDFCLELDTVPGKYTYVNWTDKEKFSLALLQPAFHYKSEHFKCKINPIIGMDLTYNSHGLLMKRWWGAEIQATIVDHVSVWGSYRDMSYNGNYLDKEYFNSIGTGTANGARISQPRYLNNFDGCQYKEAVYGGDFSDIRAGIKAYTWWGSIGIVKDNIQWGDSYHASNIISKRTPSFPMITLNLKPCKWFELNYIHGWLVSNVIDSANYYIEENYTDSTEKKHYRPANKFIAANMLTFTPIRGLDISIGNAIIYGENNVQPAYFIPIAFYKSLDHLLTKGLSTENQNSQLFFNLSSRNIKHLHLYASVFIDEIKFSRFKSSNPETNPISYKVGFQLSNFPVKNLALSAEFTRTNIITYDHSLERLTWASNSYNMGHYLGGNSQEVFVSLNYKPIRSLTINLSYVNAVKYNDYRYIRKDVINAISQKPYNEKVWQNDEIKLHALYEVVNNAYAVFDFTVNNARGYTPSSTTVIPSEIRLDADAYLQRYTPGFYQGLNFTIKCGFSFYF